MLESLRPADWIGAIGVAFMLIAFVSNILGKLAGDGVAYSLLNALGAGIAGYSSWLINFMPFVVLEGVWCVVSLFALVSALRRRPEHPVSQ